MPPENAFRLVDIESQEALFFLNTKTRLRQPAVTLVYGRMSVNQDILQIIERYFYFEIFAKYIMSNDKIIVNQG